MTIAELSIPQGWDAITPDWMTAALAAHHPGAAVEGVRVALRDDGTNRRARLELTYSAGSGPATVFAKAVDPAHAQLVALTSGLLLWIGYGLLKSDWVIVAANSVGAILSGSVLVFKIRDMRAGT